MPAFAGAYLEMGRLKLGVIDRAGTDVALAAFLQAFGDPLLRELPVEVVDMQFSFGDLVRWKQDALQAFSIEGINSLDLNEARNRIVIGIADATLSQEVHRLLTTIPDDALVFEQRDQVKRLTSIRSRFRPMAGGLQIRGNDAPFVTTCTFGINVERSGVFGMITNSHCTNGAFRVGGVDDTDFYQNDVNSSDLIGTETIDPEFSTISKALAPECPQGNGCRRSDSAFITYDASVTGQDIHFGRIMKTEYRRSSSAGSLNWDGFFEIIGEAQNHLQGTELEKVGRTTGWTFGPITDTCVDESVGFQQVLTCQYHVDTVIDSGDSGSPVFSWPLHTTDEVNIYGLAWGEAPDGDLVYSTISGIEQDLGNLTFVLQ